MTSVALFNNKGGVGKTTLTYHLAHMLQRLGHRVLAVDLDPQANLTAQFLPEDAIASLWNEAPTWSEPGKSTWLMEAVKENKGTIATAVEPIRQELGDISPLSPLEITDGLLLQTTGKVFRILPHVATVHEQQALGTDGGGGALRAAAL